MPPIFRFVDFILLQNYEQFNHRKRGINHVLHPRTDRPYKDKILGEEMEAYALIHIANSMGRKATAMADVYKRQFDCFDASFIFVNHF